MFLFYLFSSKNGRIECEEGSVSFWERRSEMALKLVELIKELSHFGRIEGTIGLRMLRGLSLGTGGVSSSPPWAEAEWHGICFPCSARA